LADPEQTHRKREKADNQKQLSHGVILFRLDGCPARCRQSAALVRSQQGRDEAIGFGAALLAKTQKKPRTMPRLFSF
jgi:hypothetical protein